MVSHHCKSAGFQRHQHSPVNGMGILGFFLLMTGGIFLMVGIATLVLQAQWFNTSVLVLGGAVMLKAGQAMLRRCEAVRQKRKQRGYLLL